MKQDAKAAQRAAGRAARAALPPDTRRQYSAALCAALAADPAVQAAKTLLAYRALPVEADPAALCAALTARGVAVAWPRCTAPGVMEARLPADDAPFVPDACGIPAPDPAHSTLVPPAALDVVLTPLTAFDAAGGRVGMGGGFYDRYLPLCSRAARIGLAFGCQQVAAAVCGPTDARLDAVYTENGREAGEPSGETGGF